MKQEQDRYTTNHSSKDDSALPGVTSRANQPFSKILFSLVSISALLAGIVVFIGPHKVLSRAVISVSEDTEYAPGYSEKAFRLVEIGDTESSIREALGIPLKKSNVHPYMRWLYAPNPSPDFETDGSYPDSRYSFTTIDFREDRTFVDAFGQISDQSRTGLLKVSSSSSFGDGVNTLSLTKADIEKLKAEKTTPEQVEAKFGKPRAVFESHVTKWLQYSHSPGNTHYRQRMIGIDRNGKVRRKVNEIYWD